MVKAPFFRVLIMCGFACAAPTLPLAASPHLSDHPLEDSAARNERSTNISFMGGSSRKIQMFIKNRHLQILPDGTVNGTTDDMSIFAIFQRTTVNVGQMVMLGTATCQYLCMDACGFLYGSKEFEDECVFNEALEQHYYNVYSSTKYSNHNRTLYVALNRKGQPRKVALNSSQPLGKLSSYTRVLTRTVTPERFAQLHHMRHQAHMCQPSTTSNAKMAVPSAGPPVEYPRCRKRKKRKKKKRKCLDTEPEHELCFKKQSGNKKLQIKVKNCETEDSIECQRDVNIKKKQKTFSDKAEKVENINGVKKKKGKNKIGKKRIILTTTEAPTILEEESASEDDYNFESTTHFDVDDSTILLPVDLSESAKSQTL